MIQSIIIVITHSDDGVGDLANLFLDFFILTSNFFQLLIRNFLFLFKFLVLDLKLLNKSFLLEKLSFVLLAINTFTIFKSLQFRHFKLLLIDKISTKGFKSFKHLLFLLFLLWIAESHNTQITGSLFIDHRTRTIITYCVGTYSTMMLPESCGKVPGTNNTIRLFLVELFTLNLNIPQSNIDKLLLSPYHKRFCIIGHHCLSSFFCIFLRIRGVHIDTTFLYIL